MGTRMKRRGQWRWIAWVMLPSLLQGCFTAQNGRAPSASGDQASQTPTAIRTDAPVPGKPGSPYAQVRPTKRPADGRQDSLAKTPLPQRPVPEPERLPIESTPVVAEPDTALSPASQVIVTKPDASAPRTLPATVVPGEPAMLSALRCYLDRQPADALRHLSGLAALNQEVLLNLLPLTVRMSEGPLTQADPQEIAAIVDQLQNVVMTLRPRAALVMDRLCFCKKVKRFGIYEALEGRPTFRSGELVEVYAEVRNVTCERPRPDHASFCTHLRSKVEIRDQRGAFGMGNDFDTSDTCHAPQHDYFQHYRFHIPAMSPGAYTLSLEITDVPTGRKVRQAMSFEIRE